MAKASTAKKTAKTSKTKKKTSRKAKRLPTRAKKKKTLKKTSKTKTAKKKPVKKSAAKKATKKTMKKATKKTVAKKSATTNKKTGPKKLARETKTKVISLTAKQLPALNQVEVEKVRVGDLAPDFTLMDQSGNSVSLSQFRGKKVVLYFYPKDDTPGCTREACSFRDHLAQFQGLNAEILGVSFDDETSHQKFIEKYGLNFSLLADVNKEVAEKFGVHVQKNMYGKTYWGIQRSTFVIDTEGRVSQVFRNVKVDGHTEEVITALEQAA